MSLWEKIHMQILPYYLHKDQSVPHDIGLKFSSLKFWTPLYYWLMHSYRIVSDQVTGQHESFSTHGEPSKNLFKLNRWRYIAKFASDFFLCSKV